MMTAEATYRPSPSAVDRYLLAGEYFTRTTNVRAQANSRVGSTAMAAIATAIGPPRMPATRNTRKDEVIPGRYAIHLDTVLMAHPTRSFVMGQLAPGLAPGSLDASGDASGRRDGFLR